ncbi:hypothetical protein AAIA72_09590 [Hahella sp. SMD15-11]|uniref:Glycolipid-binding domain-containing protein n=1 Tax=Thermohahella caldifontis TaxID=3142973 RepID=A0AB39US36_9GAMM
MTPLQNTVPAPHALTLMLLYSLASPVLAGESCLDGVWSAAEERAQLRGASGEQDILKITGSLTLELAQSPATDAPGAGWKQLRLVYQDYETLSQKQVLKMRSDRRVRFQGTAEGMWRLDEKRQEITLKPAGRIKMAAFFKAEIPEKNTENPWRKMGEGPVSAPHRNHFSVSCNGNTLTLKSDAVSGLDSVHYEGRFHRQ